MRSAERDRAAPIASRRARARPPDAGRSAPARRRRRETARLEPDPRRSARADPPALDTGVRLVLIGPVAGFFSALFGVGGGIVIVPLLLLLCAWEARAATATSLAAIGITALSGVIAYALHGDVRVEYAALVGLPAAVSVA